MTKKNIDTVKFLKKIVKDKAIEDKQTKQHNRRGSINLAPQEELDVEDLKFAKFISGLNRDCIRERK